MSNILLDARHTLVDEVFLYLESGERNKQATKTNYDKVLWWSVGCAPGEHICLGEGPVCRTFPRGHDFKLRSEGEIGPVKRESEIN